MPTNKQTNKPKRESVIKIASVNIMRKEIVVSKSGDLFVKRFERKQFTVNTVSGYMAGGRAVGRSGE